MIDRPMQTPEEFECALYEQMDHQMDDWWDQDTVHALIRARDAAVAAKALREAAEEVYGDDRAAGPYSHPLSAASWLRERADRIEREAGHPRSGVSE